MMTHKPSIRFLLLFLSYLSAFLVTSGLTGLPMAYAQRCEDLFKNLSGAMQVSEEGFDIENVLLSVQEMHDLRKVIETRDTKEARAFVQRLQSSGRTRSALNVAYYLGRLLSHENIFLFMRSVLLEKSAGSSPPDEIRNRNRIIQQPDGRLVKQSLSELPYRFPGTFSAETAVLFIYMFQKPNELHETLRDPNESYFSEALSALKSEGAKSGMGMKLKPLPKEMTFEELQNFNRNADKILAESKQPPPNPPGPAVMVAAKQAVSVNSVANNIAKKIPQGIEVEWKAKNIEEVFEQNGQFVRQTAKLDHLLIQMKDSVAQVGREVFGAFRWKKFRDFVLDFYLGYFSRDLLALDESIDLKMDARRVHTIEVTKQNQNIGTLRVFDGSKILPSHYLSEKSGPEIVELPFQWLMHVRGIASEFSNYLSAIRGQSNVRVFELGRYTLLNSEVAQKLNLGPREKAVTALAARRAMLGILEEFYCAQYPEALFVVHATKESQRDLYVGKFKMKIVETLRIKGPDGTTTEEFILSVTGAELGEALRQLNK